MKDTINEIVFLCNTKRRVQYVRGNILIFFYPKIQGLF